MLKPALLYKEELLQKFTEQLYTPEYCLYIGCPCGTILPEITERENHYQYAILDKDKVVGYLAYYIDNTTDTVCSFGLYSFDKGNYKLGKDVYNKMVELVKTHRRVEWRIIGNNPTKHNYDNFCKKFNGYIHHLHETTKDIKGNYVDEYTYEIINGGI